MATFTSNNYNGRVLTLTTSQSGSKINWTLTSSGGSVNYYTIYNLKITINGTVVYNPGTVSWNSYAFPAATGSTSGSVDVGHSASSRNISVSFIGAVYYNRTTENGGTMTVAATISKPTLSALSSSNVADKSAKLTFSVTNTNNGSITGYGIQISESNFGTVVKSATSYSNTFTNLTPYKQYYARGYATNAAGTTYTSVIGFKTTFVNPGNPGKPSLSYDQTEPIPRAKITASWSAASAGSTAVAGYRVRLYKNNTQVAMIDTESTSTSYTFPNTLEDYGFTPGDVLKVGIYSYSKDWNGDKHFNGDGVSSSQVYSNELTIVSDKYIYVSVNGGTFDKHKMYVSVSGGSFVEVKKEKFKVIK